MVDGDPKVEVSINADANTGAIDVTAAQVDKLAGSVLGLLGPLGELGTAAGIVAFFKEAADAAEENVQALAHLRSQLGAAGLDVEADTETVKRWAEALQAVSRFGAPELEAALSRVVARTGNLAESQKLVQLAMNVSVATGRDFNSELDTLAQAAGGSARGVQQLQRELGQSAVGVTDINQLLNMLSARYKDNAETSDTLTDKTAQAKNAFHDLLVVIGDSLTPALRGLASIVPSVITTMEGLWSAIEFGIKEVTTLAGANSLKLLAIAEGTARVMKDLATGNFADISAARADYQRKAAEINQAAKESELKTIQETRDQVETINNGGAAAQKALIKNVGEFKGIQGKADIAQELETTKAEIEAVDAEEKARLAMKNIGSKQRLQIVANALQDELDILDAHHKAYLGKEAQFQAERQKLVSEGALKRTQIEQKYVTDRIAATEAWRNSHLEVMANMEAAGRQMADGIATSFGQSVAKCIVEGTNLRTALHQLAIQVAEEIIAQLIRIEVEAAIAKAALLLL